MTVPALAQQKKGSKSKTEQKRELPPSKPEETKIDVVASPQQVKTSLDTAAAPEDAHTRAARQVLQTTNAMDLGAQFANLILKRDQLDPQHVLPDEFFTRFSDAMTKGQGRVWFENMLVHLYREFFTIDELQEMNRFYATPLGKKMIAQLPALIAESNKRGEQLGQIIGKEIFTQLVAEGKIKEQ